MISSLRNFAKTKVAGIFIFIIIIPFVFWGMGSVFNSGNTNNIAKINNTNISTQDFMDYLNQSGLSSEVIQNNIDKNIIEELLSGLVSTTLLNLEIKDLNLSISNDVLTTKIKKDKNFLDENGVFQRTNYEKFLLLNNLTAPMYELNLKNKALQKQLFEYIGSGTLSPKFLIKKMYKEENRKVEIETIDLNNVYKKKVEFTLDEIQNFLDKNKNQLRKDYIDFSYVIITPKNLIGLDEFNENFFKKIDDIENKISKNISFKSIINEIDIKPTNVFNYTLSKNKNKIEDKIFEIRNNKKDILEYEGSYFFYEITRTESKLPNLNIDENKKQITNLLYQKNKFDFNKKILDEISNKEFDDASFKKLGKNFIQKYELKSIKDIEKFEQNSLEIIYSLPKNSFTLISDGKKNIYATKIINFKEASMKINENTLGEFNEKQNTNFKKTFLQSYDFLLNKKYEVTINQKTLDRVKNYFQ
jgi:peptidyl-prolyl cis-trans isomerase D